MKHFIKHALKIGHLSTAYHTNFIIMGQEDLEKDLKNKINWQLFGTGPEMVEAFAKEKLDGGYMGLPPAIIGIDQNVPIKCVAGGHMEGTIMIALKKYKPISVLKYDLREVLSQFIGKSIGVPSKGSIHDVILNHFLDKYALRDDISVKHYKQSEFIALDMKNAILDGGVGTPSLAIFAATITDSHIVITPEYLWKNNPSYGVFFHKKIIEEDPETVIKFLDLHKKASYLLRNSPDQAAELIARSFSILDKNYVKNILKISPKYCIALSEDYLNCTMEFIKILRELGYVKNNLTKEEIFNFDFIKKVHPEAEHYSQPD